MSCSRNSRFYGARLRSFNGGDWDVGMAAGTFSSTGGVLEAALLHSLKTPESLASKLVIEFLTVWNISSEVLRFGCWRDGACGVWVQLWGL